MTRRLRVAALVAGMAAAIVAAVPLVQCVPWRPTPPCIASDDPAFDPNGPQWPECYIPGDW